MRNAGKINRLIIFLKFRQELFGLLSALATYFLDFFYFSPFFKNALKK